MKRYYLRIDRKGETKKIEFDTIEGAKFLASAVKIFKPDTLIIVDKVNGNVIKC